MTTSKINVAASAPARSTGPRMVTPLNSFPVDDCVSLLRLGGSLAADVGANGVLTGSGTFLSGGGINLSGLAYITAGIVDVTAEWTIIAGLTLPAPASVGSAGRRALAALAADYPLRGLAVWNEVITGGDISTNALHTHYLQMSLNGSVFTEYPNIPADQVVGRFGKPQTLVIRHHGGGSLSVQQRVGANVGPVATEVTLDNLRGFVTDKVSAQAARFGAITDVANGSCIYDCLAAYTRCLTNRELELWTAAHQALALTRGRS